MHFSGLTGKLLRMIKGAFSKPIRSFNLHFYPFLHGSVLMKYLIDFLVSVLLYNSDKFYIAYGTTHGYKCNLEE